MKSVNMSFIIHIIYLIRIIRINGRNVGHIKRKRVTKYVVVMTCKNLISGGQSTIKTAWRSKVNLFRKNENI